MQFTSVRVASHNWHQREGEENPIPIGHETVLFPAPPFLFRCQSFFWFCNIIILFQFVKRFGELMLIITPSFSMQLSFSAFQREVNVSSHWCLKVTDSRPVVENSGLLIPGVFSYALYYVVGEA